MFGSGYVFTSNVGRNKSNWSNSRQLYYEQESTMTSPFHPGLGRVGTFSIKQTFFQKETKQKLFPPHPPQGFSMLEHWDA